ncbi:WD40 repeat domain-containing protein [Corallococcus macrosporus]|uniref:WD40 repeat domain-containing protein n=1 Tax=Corallococcus macrosporus TaxID=35 RepID=A0ABS3DB79_9BACT|nr:WD40 repeat domain-containing protein [Corallococcus macrosporus]MBN8227605.1 WD40 repeat domain-containing protein [Corallococcus macrosporus]
MFSHDSRFAAAVVTDHEQEQAFLYLWDLTTDRHPWILPLGFAFAESVAFHPTRPLLVAGGIHEMVVVDVNERRELKRLNDVHHYASNLDFSPDGQLLVSSADGRGFVLHDFETGGLLFSHSDDNDEQTSDAVFSPDGRFIAWAQGDGTVGLWGID